MNGLYKFDEKMLDDFALRVTELLSDIRLDIRLDAVPGHVRVIHPPALLSWLLGIE